MRRILTAVVALAALVLGAGAGVGPHFALSGFPGFALEKV